MHDTEDAPGIAHDHGSEPHHHPHGEPDPSGHPRLGLVGAGRAGTALGLAFSRAGWPVAAIASRDPARRDRFTQLVPTARPVEEPADLVDEVDIVVLAVPDDMIARVAAQSRLYSGQSIVHTSGALAASALDAARAAGTSAGSFHPLVAIADPERAVADFHGATVAIEGDKSLMPIMADLARAIGANPVQLPPGGKPAYHAAAMLAAGGFIGLLDGIAEVARGAGLDAAGAVAIYAPLIRQSLANAEALGIDAALTGPLARGDRGTVSAHLAALRALAPGAIDLYRSVARREVDIAQRRGQLEAHAARDLRALLDDDA